MTTIATSLRSDLTTVAHQPQAASGLAIVRLTIGVMFVWVFFENLGKGLYTPAGYAGLINYYIKASHRPAAFVAFLYLGSLWISEWGTAWIWELLVPVLASLGLAIGRAGRRWGVDAWLSQRWPSSPWW